jgi:hypothetical protein
MSQGFNVQGHKVQGLFVMVSESITTENDSKYHILVIDKRV